MKAKLHLKQWLIIGVLLVGLGLALAPARAEGGLPDRNPPPPSVHNGGETDTHRDNTPLGAAIELITGPPGGMSVVQWQDANGDWQEVTGWRGALDSSGYIRWWVAAKDFGTGPFRWLVGDPATPTAISESFYLPAVGAATLRVIIP